MSRNGDGVKVVATGGVRKSVAWIAAAVVLSSLAALVLFFVAGGSRDAPPPVPEPPARLEAAAPAPERKEEPTAPVAKRHARAVTRATPAAPEPTAPPDDPPAREDAPFAFGPPGEKTGIALFPSRDTKPIKVGIVVPDDFEVPEGYLRHYQASEDGEMLPAILLFHPDYEWVDDEGHAIELPADRVVPPELAPPGLSIQMLQVPAAQDGAR